MKEGVRVAPTGGQRHRLRWSGVGKYSSQAAKQERMINCVKCFIDRRFCVSQTHLAAFLEMLCILFVCLSVL